MFTFLGPIPIGVDSRTSYDIAKKLSVDAPPKQSRYDMSGYIIYANGAEWYISGMGAGYCLIWIHRVTYANGEWQPLTDDQRYELIKTSDPVFQCDWLDPAMAVDCMKYIIRNHPNVRPNSWYQPNPFAWYRRLLR